MTAQSATPARRFDVAVIGAGMLGASATYRLASAGRRVALVEAREPASGTSGNSFAWLNAVHKEPEPYHRLNADGVAFYERLREELGPRIGYHGGGSLAWAETADAYAAIRERVARLAARGYPAAWISRSEALRLEPDLAISADAEGVAYYPAEGWLDAPRLVRTFVNRALAEGAEVWRGSPVRSLRRDGDRIAAVETDRGEISADQVLVCVGIHTPDLLEPLGVTLPVNRVAGLLAVTTPLAERPHRVVHAPGLHLRPDPGGGLLLGADDIDALTTEATPPGEPPAYATPLLERLTAVYPPARGARLASVRIGVRPIPADGLTAAGPLPGIANGWVIVTHSGITLGPLLGALVAAEMLGGAPDPRLASFRPARFVGGAVGGAPALMEGHG